MRRDRNVFLEDNGEDLRKSFCKNCEKNDGIYRKLVPRIIDGIRDDKFQVCSFCGSLVPLYDIELYTEYEPKGYVSDNPFSSGTKVENVQTLRRLRNQKRRQVADNDIEVPKFAGKRDEFLENLVNDGAIVTSISDSGDI